MPAHLLLSGSQLLFLENEDKSTPSSRGVFPGCLLCAKHTLGLGNAGSQAILLQALGNSLGKQVLFPPASEEAENGKGRGEWGRARRKLPAEAQPASPSPPGSPRAAGQGRGLAGGVAIPGPSLAARRRPGNKAHQSPRSVAPGTISETFHLSIYPPSL